MNRIFLPEYLTREERARIDAIDTSIKYFDPQNFAGASQASREWANARYWELMDERHMIRCDAHDRARRRDLQEAYDLLSEIAWKGGLGCYGAPDTNLMAGNVLLEIFELAAAILRQWGFKEYGTTFVNEEYGTVIRLEYWPEEVKY